ncbi:hypothetical protein A2819_00790 [Candidatus Azambacteria bacterium RIFCSPHIGHO2_01_FULL_40_24]|uniref:Multidrug ABC transporter substrate-binding protein n=1 Tax=Candidatus Azambacteria bacterium RIFCSPHIGHO2_01_FULL_40_24 TaxID=1797301 RepID=A0A1F5B4Z1_9BACT|nr:MAG: hypothetical protein A2819_00790 [Candidatus Azambacteria bacterium RIFCSPHIGHO2_01_FULL_40_24]
MNIKHQFKTAFSGIKTNKGRAVLTILGIVIGITAIILVMALGQGAQNLILGQIQSIGSKTIVVAPGRHPKGPADIIATFTDSLKARDLEILERKENVPHLFGIMPIVFGAQTAAYGNETYRPTIFGATDFFAKIYDIYPNKGRLFTNEEVKGYSSVVVIGKKVKEELFGNEEAIGKNIRIKGKSFKVIGVFPAKGQVSFLNIDEVAIVPYTTAQQYIFGIKYFHRFIVEIDEEKNIPQTIDDIEIALRNSHGITDPEKDDFFVESQADAVEMVKTVTDILTLFLTAIAAISLLVGGVGIMNIMLVSVTERTREIGLRKAIGASGNEIMLQFLLEAVILTFSGGILGIIFGASLSFLAAIILSTFVGLSWSFVFPFSAAILGLAVATLVGLIFGLYPARKASLKSPIEALRYE